MYSSQTCSIEREESEEQVPKKGKRAGLTNRNKIKAIKIALNKKAEQYLDYLEGSDTISDDREQKDKKGKGVKARGKTDQKQNQDSSV